MKEIAMARHTSVSLVLRQLRRKADRSIGGRSRKLGRCTVGAGCRVNEMIGGP